MTVSISAKPVFFLCSVSPFFSPKFDPVLTPRLPLVAVVSLVLSPFLFSVLFV